MKHLFMTTLLAISLSACGGVGETSAQTQAPSPALVAELPTLSGGDVWNMTASESYVTFEAYYNGDFTGAFQSFATVIKLNPDTPETGEIHAIVDLASVTAKDSDVTNNLPLSDWFDVANHPHAKFSSTDITALGGGNYKADGQLTLKGITQSASLTFGLDVAGNTAHATGGFDLLRTDFNVGTGSDFENEQWVRFPVKVMVDIKATR